jgi:hypothetical protein
MFKRVLEEEEKRVVGFKDRELAKLVHWREQSGVMWLHMLRKGGSNYPPSFILSNFILYVGIDDWERCRREVDYEDVEAFGTQKGLQLEQYDREFEKKFERAPKD